MQSVICKVLSHSQSSPLAAEARIAPYEIIPLRNRIETEIIPSTRAIVLFTLNTIYKIMYVIWNFISNAFYDHFDGDRAEQNYLIRIFSPDQRRKIPNFRLGLARFVKQPKLLLLYPQTILPYQKGMQIVQKAVQLSVMGNPVDPV